MQDITELSMTDKAEIASYIREDTLEVVNSKSEKVNPKISFYTKYGKRVLDFIFAFIGFIISSPINLVVGVVTIFDVGFPIIFKQQRIGRFEKKFTIYKFRNMTNDTDVNGKLLPPSERVTKWGKFVRKTSLDELLNFVSVLKGDMSIIGPRPLLDYYVERLNDKHRSMYLIRPGLECPVLRKVDHPLSWQERLDNYVWYVENCSLAIDIQLCLRLVAMVFEQKSVQVRANANQGGFLGYDLDGNIISTKAVPDKYIDKYCQIHNYANLEEAVKARRINI